MRQERHLRSQPPQTGLGPTEIDRVRAVLYLSGIRGDDLADATQEVHLRTIERSPDELRSRATWASVVAANLARDWHRLAGRYRTMQNELAKLTPTEVTDPDVALKLAISAGLSQLDPDLRQAVVLRFYVDLPVRDIAEVLGIPEGTVKSRLHRAMSVMRELLPKESVT